MIGRYIYDGKFEIAVSTLVTDGSLWPAGLLGGLGFKEWPGPTGYCGYDNKLCPR